MQETKKPLPSLASIRLEESATMQLSELAQYHGRSFDHTATFAIHAAYLSMLNEKYDSALEALHRQLDSPDIDDEIPF
jgi:hypothetical protein